MQDEGAKRDGWTNGGRLLPPSRIKGGDGGSWTEFQTRVPSLYPVPPILPSWVRLVFFFLPVSFLCFFLVAVRCLRLTSRVTSCQKGFASRQMTAGGWYVAFSCDVSPIAKEKGLAAMVMAQMGGKERMRSRFTAVRSPLRCCARKAQCYKWPRRYAYPNRLKTRQHVRGEKRKTHIYLELAD